jgi:phosphoheptose isomerase
MGRSSVGKARRPRRPHVVSNGLPCISTSTETGGQSSQKLAQRKKISLPRPPSSYDLVSLAVAQHFFEYVSQIYPLRFWGSIHYEGCLLLNGAMRKSSETLKSAIVAAKATLQSLVNLDAEVANAADLIEQCLRAGNKLLVCGNGGSAADAAHFATELVVRFVKDRRAYPAICLTGDGGLLTAAGNDYGFDEVFARQVAAFGLPDDLLICLTSSGKSENVKRALEEARARKLKTIAFLGRDGGSTIGMADVDLLVAGDSTARIQEAHQLLLHILCEIIESRLNQT